MWQSSLSGFPHLNLLFLLHKRCDDCGGSISHYFLVCFRQISFLYNLLSSSMVYNSIVQNLLSFNTFYRCIDFVSEKLYMCCFIFPPLVDFTVNGNVMAALVDAVTSCLAWKMTSVTSSIIQHEQTLSKSTVEHSTGHGGIITSNVPPPS